MTTIQLTPEQHLALTQNGVEPVRVIDPVSQKAYLMVSEEKYALMRSMPYDDSEFDVREAYPLMDEMARKAGWDDPSMDIYNDLAQDGKS